MEVEKYSLQKLFRDIKIVFRNFYRLF